MKDKRALTDTVIMLFVSALLILCIAFFTTPLMIRLSGDETETVECGDIFEDPGAELRLGIGELKSEGHVDTSKVGEYEIIYTFLTERKVRTVMVVDTTRPEIKLEGSTSISIVKGGPYTEQGYSAWDIADGDLTEAVWTESDVDLGTPGEYHISYYVSDSSGNTTRERRRVVVTDKGPMTMDMVSFDLNPYYPDVICREAPFDQAKYENTVFFFFFFIGYMRDYRVGIVENLWSRGGMTPEQIYTRDINVGLESEGLTFFDAMDREKPDTVIILLGNQVSRHWTPDYFRTVFDGIYASLASRYPDTNIVICSLAPFSREGDAYNIRELGFSRNDRINKINTVYCELCRKYGFKFMNVAEVLKDPADGYCKADLMGPDYFHLSKKGFTVMLEYVQAHMDWE